MAEADLESPEIGSSTEKKSDVSKKETVASMEVQQQTVEQTSSLQEETVASKKGSSFRKPVAKAAKEEPQEQGWE
jgi:hypothetical protein